MASLTMDDWSKGLRKMGEQLRKLKEENPQLFEPWQIVVVEDDGAEVDLCDITKQCPIDLR